MIRFFQSHRWLLSDPRFAEEAAFRLDTARHHLAATRAQAARARAAIEWRARQARKQRAPGGRVAHSPRDGDLPRFRRPTAARRSRSRAASPATARPRRTASTSACSRWARASVGSSATARPRSSRQGPRTGTSSARDATGAPGRASRGATDVRTISCAKCGTRLVRPGSHGDSLTGSRATCAVLAEGRPPPASRRGSCLRALPRRPRRIGAGGQAPARRARYDLLATGEEIRAGSRSASTRREPDPALAPPVATA